MTFEGLDHLNRSVFAQGIAKYWAQVGVRCSASLTTEKLESLGIGQVVGCFNVPKSKRLDMPNCRGSTLLLNKPLFKKSGFVTGGALVSVSWAAMLD